MTKFRLFLATATAVLLMLCVSSCSFYDMLGIDTHDYLSEQIIAEHKSDSDIALQISDMIPMIIQNTPYLSEFDTPSLAAQIYRDSILCDILTTNYAKYNANAALIEQAHKIYPEYEITTLIPAVDFESTVYKNFGGTESISNESTELFTYLDKIDAYISVGIGVDNSASIMIESLYETEHTYICEFYNVMSDTTSDNYKMYFMKREDGSIYMRKLEIVEK